MAKKKLSQAEIVGRKLAGKPIETPIEEYIGIPEPLPLPEEKVFTPATPNAIPRYTYNKDGSVLEEMPTGEKATYTREQWSAKRDQEMARSGGGGYKPTSGQVDSDTVSKFISEKVQEALARGETPDYKKIFEEMAANRDLQNQISQVRAVAESERNKPLEPFQENKFNPMQGVAFGATGAGSAIGATSGLMAVGSAIGGNTAALGALANPLTLAAASVAFIGGVIAAKSFNRNANIKQATRETKDSIATLKNVVRVAGQKNYPDRLQLVEAYETQKRQIRAYDSYLQEKQREGIWSRTDIANVQADINNFYENERMYDSLFYSSIMSMDSEAADMSFLSSEVPIETMGAIE